MDRWRDGWMDGLLKHWKDGGWMDEWIDGGMEGWRMEV